MDRNLIGSINRAIDIMSLSARRAWIEISGGWKVTAFFISRSPQGERG